MATLLKVSSCIQNMFLVLCFLVFGSGINSVVTTWAVPKGTWCSQRDRARQNGWYHLILDDLPYGIVITNQMSIY